MEPLGDGVHLEVFLVHAAFPRVVQVLGMHDTLEVLDRLEQRTGFTAERDLEQGSSCWRIGSRPTCLSP